MGLRLPFKELIRIQTSLDFLSVAGKYARYIVCLVKQQTYY